MKGFLCFSVTQNVNGTQGTGAGQCQCYSTPSCRATEKLYCPMALRTQKNHTQEPCTHQQPNSGNGKSGLSTGNGAYFIHADNAYTWLPKHSCFQALLTAPLRVLWRQPQHRIRSKRAFSVRGVQDNLQLYSLDFGKPFNSMLLLL